MIRHQKTHIDTHSQTSWKEYLKCDQWPQTNPSKQTHYVSIDLIIGHDTFKQDNG